MKLSEKSLGFLSWALGSDECQLQNLIMDYCSISTKVLDGLGIFCCFLIDSPIGTEIKLVTFKFAK